MCRGRCRAEMSAMTKKVSLKLVTLKSSSGEFLFHSSIAAEY